MIANYRVQTELSSVESTADGRAIILGTVDGCISVLAITDPAKPEMAKYLSTMPSRDEDVSTVKNTYNCLIIYLRFIPHCTLETSCYFLMLFTKYTCISKHNTIILFM